MGVRGGADEKPGMSVRGSCATVVIGQGEPAGAPPGPALDRGMEFPPFSRAGHWRDKWALDGLWRGPEAYGRSWIAGWIAGWIAARQGTEKLASEAKGGCEVQACETHMDALRWRST